MVLGYLIVISIVFFTILYLHFVLSFSFNWEDINIKHSWWCLTTFPNSSKFNKNTPSCTSYFKRSSWCLEMYSNMVFRVWYINFKSPLAWFHCWISSCLSFFIPFKCIPSFPAERRLCSSMNSLYLLHILRFKGTLLLIASKESSSSSGSFSLAYSFLFIFSFLASSFACLIAAL